MNRNILAIGDTGAQLVTKFNTNFQKSHLSGNWFNVEDYGAIHDNSHDDTAAIQAAIAAWVAGGCSGTVYCPNGIYKIAGALQNHIPTINDATKFIDYNSQIYVPAHSYISYWLGTLRIMGETPPKYFQNGFAYKCTTGVIFNSTIAGSGVFPSVICSKGYTTAASFNYNDVILENIVVLVNPFVATGGPSMSGVNMLNSSHTKIKNVFTGLYLDDFTTAVQPTSHVFGMAIGGVNGDFPQIEHYGAFGGFYYGLITNEGVHANNIMCACNYIGLMALDRPYGTLIDYAVLHWNAYDIAAQQESINGVDPGPTTIRINFMTSEDNAAVGPAWTNRVDEILDTNNYLYGEMAYSIVGNGGVGTENNIVKSHGGYNFNIRNIARGGDFHWATSERPSDPYPSMRGYNTTTNKTETWNGSTWNNLF